MQDLITESPFPEIAETDILPLFTIEQDIAGNIFACEPVDDIETVGDLLLESDFGTRFFFFDLDIVLGGQPSQGFDVRIFFVLHQESDGVSATPTSEAFVYFFWQAIR